MRSRSICALHSSAIILFLIIGAYAQSGSTRPRRVNPIPEQRTAEQIEDSSGGRGSRVVNTGSTTPAVAAKGDTSRAFLLFQQKQYEAAAKEARQVALQYPNDPEAWKIIGFSELGLKRYPEAADALQKSLNLQKAAGTEDAHTADALAQAYTLVEKYDLALPLLIAATTREGSKPDFQMLYYRGLAEHRTGKPAEAEKSFTAASKLNPKHAATLFYLGQIAYNRNDLDAAIAALNRATVADAKSVSAWSLLATAYLRRAATATVAAKAEADYLSAVRAAESLTALSSDGDTLTLLGQALIGAQQFPRAATVLERASLSREARPVTFYLLGVAHSRAKNFPKAVEALEKAASMSQEDANIYRELGYALEVSKQYRRALEVYERGARLDPGDAYFRDSVERVRPLASGPQ